MKARHKRMALLSLALLALLGAAFFVLSAFQKNLVFFFSPSQVLAGEAPAGRAFRIGGLVETGSLQRMGDGLTVHFTVTDLAERMQVTYTGMLPDLFREGQGVVAQGRLDEKGRFVADQVLAKHDENYMPKEAAEAMEKGRMRISDPSSSGYAGRGIEP